MEHLAPVTWQNVATKDDLASLHVLTRQDLGVAMAELRSDLRGEMAELRTDLRVELAGVRTDLHKDINAQTWKLMTFLAGWSALLVTIVGIVR